MDIVKIIRDAVDALPDGEYRAGLRAIQRHIGVAIKHFERDDDGELDSFTDAIYRCNQAFEGALKEAYRVLANKDPSKVTPHKIEEYLEKNKVIRPRALKQLTRYREDYRNPSAHDYKLDFDEDEALLAITAVCAFTKLLTNQIASKVAFDKGKSAASTGVPKSVTSSEEMRQVIAEIIIEAMNATNASNLSYYEQLQFFLAGVLESSGYEVDQRPEDNGDPDDCCWNILVEHGDYRVAVEVRTVPHCNLRRSREWIEEEFGQESVENAILVVSDNAKHSGFEALELSTERGGLTMIHPQDGLNPKVDEDEFASYLAIKSQAS